MTGLFVTAMKDGQWTKIEIDRLSDDEFDAFIEHQKQNNPNPDQGWIWAKFLAGWIRDHAS